MIRRLRHAALTALALLIILASAELAVRYLHAVMPDPPGRAYVSDPDCAYRLRPTEPGRYDEDADRHVNALGFRDRNHHVAKPAGRFRVIGMGDSQVYGEVPIALNVLRVLQDSLAAAGAPDPETVIAGVPGWDVRNANGWLRSTGLGLDPDVAVLVFSVGSDVTGLPITGRVYQGNLHFTGSHLPLRNLLLKSRLYVVWDQVHEPRIRRAWRRLVHGEGDRRTPAGPRDLPGLHGLPGLDDPPVKPRPRNLDRQLANLRLYRTAPAPDVERWWSMAESQVLEFRRLCTDAGVRPLLLISPDEIQVDRDLRLAVLERAPLPADAYDFDLPSRRLARFAEAAGLPVLDALDGLRAAASTTRLRPYIPNNGHWSVPGNAVVAGLLADAVAAGQNWK